VLAELTLRLKAGGVLIVGTGDGDAAEPREHIANYWYMRNIEHLVMLNRAHCAFVARSLGLHIREQHQVSHYNLSMAEAFSEWLKYSVYMQFEARPSSLLTRLMHYVPRFNRAARWPAPPPRTYRQDHIIVVMEKA
jgi:hypothetical protein